MHNQLEEIEESKENIETDGDDAEFVKEGFLGLLFEFIEYVFCIKISEQYLNKFYNEHTLLTL